MFTLLGIFLPLSLVINVISFGALAAFTMVNLSVIRTFALRQNSEVRDFKSALRYVVFPLIGTIFTFWLWTSLTQQTLIVGLLWLLGGFVILLIVTRGFKRRVPTMDLSEKTAADAAGPSTEHIDLLGADYPFRDGKY